MIYHGTFISDGNNHFNGKLPRIISMLPWNKYFGGPKYFVTAPPINSLRECQECPWTTASETRSFITLTHIINHGGSVHRYRWEVGTVSVV